MTDPISDMLTRIRNAYTVRHLDVKIPHSKLKEDLAQLLQQSGYINSFSVIPGKPRKIISIELKYQGKHPAIDGLVRISKPGRRIYARSHKIPNSLGGQGITILSTNKGLMTDQKARKSNIGGEILCKVW